MYFGHTYALEVITILAVSQHLASVCGDTNILQKFIYTDCRINGKLSFGAHLSSYRHVIKGEL